MSDAYYTISRFAYLLAGATFLELTLFGCVAVMGIGFDTVQDVLLDLSLTLAFPIFLVVFWSSKTALVLSWVFFVAQWIETCSVGAPPRLISPFANWHGFSLFLADIFLTLAVIAGSCSKQASWLR